MLLQYRAAAVAGMSTQIFWGWIRVMIFGAFYASTVDPQPMSYAEVVDYVWLGQALLMLIPIWVDQDIRGLVRQGTVAYELVRPLDLYAYWYARSGASRRAPALLRAEPIIALALLFFDLRPPASAASAMAWIATPLGALLRKRRSTRVFAMQPRVRGLKGGVRGTSGLINRSLSVSTKSIFASTAHVDHNSDPRVGRKCAPRARQCPLRELLLGGARSGGHD